MFDVDEPMKFLKSSKFIASIKDAGTQPEFTEEELIKVIKTNDKITRKEIAAHFEVSLRTVQRYLNTMESVRYVGSGKSGHLEIKQD